VRRTSRDKRHVHSGARDDVRFLRASAQAQAVTTFLQEQDVRPAPREPDIEEFLGRSDAILFFAQRDNQIIGTLGCVLEATVLRLVFFSVANAWPDHIVEPLVSLAEAHGRSAGAALLAIQALSGSQAERALRARGFSLEWEEGDALGGRVVNVVDLIKPL
jgi:hypothetical protein